MNNDIIENRERRPLGGIMMSKKSGFSLVEIMLVMAIIGLLVSLLLPAIGRARWNAQMNKCRSKLQGMNGELNNHVTKANGMYACYRSIQSYCQEGDPLPQGRQLWRLLQFDMEDTADDKLRSDQAQLRKQVYELFVCNIKGDVATRGRVSYRGPNFVLSVASMEGGVFIGGDDLTDHGRQKGRQINVLRGDGGVVAQVYDDPQFQQTYNQTTIAD